MEEIDAQNEKIDECIGTLQNEHNEMEENILEKVMISMHSPNSINLKEEVLELREEINKLKAQPTGLNKK